MKFTLQNEPFASALAKVRASVPARSTIPILSHIAVTASAGQISIRATDLVRETEAVIAADVSSEGGTALPGEVLLGIGKKLNKGGECSISLAGDRAKVVSGSSKYDLATLALEDFPVMAAPGDDRVMFHVEAKELRSLIGHVSYALAGTGDNRHYLRGVHLHTEGARLVAVATDGHRLARDTISLPKGAATMPGTILPEETVRQMLDLLGEAEGDVSLAVSDKRFALTLPGLKLVSAVVEGVFPAYGKLIPKRNGSAAMFRPHVLGEAIERASVVYLSERDSNRRLPVIACAAKDGELHLRAGIKGAQQATETVEAETNGHALDFSVNASYLQDMLRVWPETATVAISQESAGSPILFVSAEWPEQTHIVMPHKGLE